ncbi:MAG: hypothetical protein DME00_37060 [Candidatus Rokuibacteriota bacterium]|nr:MAG: hypothetical protein DME00_37060 [Candidatus Rokubacteria bacterium]
MVAGVSLVENYRAQIAHVLRASSYAGLVGRLRSEAAAGGPSSTRHESRTAVYQVQEVRARRPTGRPGPTGPPLTTQLPTPGARP